jgi:hypothetical protein
MPLAVDVVDSDSAHNAEAGFCDGSFFNGIVAGGDTSRSFIKLNRQKPVLLFHGFPTLQRKVSGIVACCIPVSFY